MNREEILAMKPGRELDKIIAVDVLSGYPLGFDYLLMNGKLRRLRNYSTRIQDAWKVVEEIINNYTFDLYFDDVGECWVCKLFDGRKKYRGYGNAPETICKAALLAKLETKDD